MRRNVYSVGQVNAYVKNMFAQDFMLRQISVSAEEEGILIAYASIHGNTKQAAEKMRDILIEKGAKNVVIMDLSRDDMARAVENAFRYSKMVLACATYDGGIFPCMEDFLNHLKAKNYQKRTVAFMENGSWAPAAAKLMKGMLEKQKDLTIVEPVVTIRSTMKPRQRPYNLLYNGCF